MGKLGFGLANASICNRRIDVATAAGRTNITMFRHIPVNVSCGLTRMGAPAHCIVPRIRGVAIR